MEFSFRGYTAQGVPSRGESPLWVWETTPTAPEAHCLQILTAVTINIIKITHNSPRLLTSPFLHFYFLGGEAWPQAHAFRRHCQSQ